MNNIKLLLKGEIKLLSPTIIGSGENDNTDSDILLNSEGIPFIPATSIAGVISSFISKTDGTNIINEIFGGNESQSKIVFYDLTLKEDSSFSISKRDGIAIDNTIGITKESSKYDYEIIDKGAVFNFEILLNDNDIKLLNTIIEAFKTKKLRIGAKTNNGFGEVTIDNYKVYKYDFSKKNSVLKWLKREVGEDITDKLGSDIYEYRENYIDLELTFSIKDSLIIKSYDEGTVNADSTHLKSKDDYIISGSSLKGALRARTERIFNTLNPNNKMLVGKLIGNLFGEKGESDNGGQKGRLSVNEVNLPKMDSKIQQRIKIDRFTGGTIAGALFDSMPVFSNGEKIKRMEIKISRAEESDMGILLLLLKDLWTEDLPIGGEKSIGRGVLKGIEAKINYYFGEKQGTVLIDKNISGIKDNKDFFQEFVNKL